MNFERICHEDRLFPVEPQLRELSRQLYKEISSLPIISPHGHTDPSWFSEDKNFSSVSDVFVTPDHYLLRMFYSQGLDLSLFGLSTSTESKSLDDKEIWRNFAKHFYLFRGTPSWMWFNHVFQEVFGIDGLLSPSTAELFFEKIQSCLAQPEFKPLALLKKFNIEVLATTDHASDSLEDHKKLRGLKNRVIPTFRPDRATNPEHVEFKNELLRLGELTGENTKTYSGYLKALKARRAFFKERGATATDHGHPDAYTCWLEKRDVEKLFEQALSSGLSPADARAFRGHMLMEMAQMSLEDGLVMQLHSGVYRNHNPWLYSNYGPDKGADIPTTSEFVTNLKPLLDRFGNEKNFTLILFTLDESTYSRELAPLAGHYPAVKLGPPWWFHDSPEGLRRFREQALETAGFYNLVGFIDDTRAFFSIPARHDVARRMDCHMMARWIGEHRITLTEALETLKDLTYNLPKRSFRL